MPRMRQNASESDDGEEFAVLSAQLYCQVRAILRAQGYEDEYRWAQTVTAPATAEAWACEYVWVVLNSGMRNTVARGIMNRLWPALVAGESARSQFRHPGKTAAIDEVWRTRAAHFAAYLAASDKVGYCANLPWIGPITKWHLAKNLGLDVAKPDRWLERLAAVARVPVADLCARLAAETGDRVATVDVVLWRACSAGVLSMHEGRFRVRSPDRALRSQQREDAAQ